MKKSTENNQLTLFEIECPSPVASTNGRKKSAQSGSVKAPEKAVESEYVKSLKKKGLRIAKLAANEGLKIKGVVIHDNVHNLASIDKRRNLRLQVVFFNADDSVLKSLFHIIARKRQNGDDEKVNTFLAENPPHKGKRKITRQLMQDLYSPVGRYYDLRKILADVMKKYTGQVDNIVIGWRTPSAGRSSVTWGSFRDLGNGGIIRINALLDRPDVPKYVVESVVFHELLHFISPAESNGRKRKIHTKDFKELLAEYPRLEEAEIWKKGYFKRLRSSRIR
jgi:predicted metal-dependent hydrolase